MSNEAPQLNSLRVESFSGGMTDYYVGNPDSSKFQLADNQVINDNQDLITRPGSLVYNENNEQVLSGEERVGAVVECDDITYQQSGRSLYYIDGAMAEVLGPTSNKVFPSGDDTLKASFAVWNKHLICASEEYSPIMRIYKNESGDIKVNNLGLPSTELYSCLELANSLKAKFNSHIANVAQHTAGADAVNAVTASDATTFDTLVTLVAQLLTKYAAHRLDATLVTPLFHAATSSANALANTASPTSLFQIKERLDDLKDKFNAHDADGTAHGTTSVNQETKNSIFKVTAGGAGANNYIYAIYYSHTYYVNDVQFKELGAVSYVELSSALAPDSSSVSLSTLPAIVNGSVNNYATSDIKIEIARTTNNGDVFYYIGEVTSGTTTYTDSKSDTTLQDSFPIYITGGVLDNEEPPRGKYIRIVNDSLVIANLKEGSVIKPNKARISKSGIPYAHPETFYTEFEDDITGCGGLNVYPLIFLKRKSYRLEGSLDTFGRGSYQKREISTRIGCVSPLSIVDTRDGVMFASEDGFYFTDAFRVTKCSKEINKTYAALSEKENICSSFDKTNNWVLFGVKSDSSSLENDTIFVGHWNYSREDGEVPFTTWSGGNDASNFTVSCLGYIDNTILRGDRRGYLFKHVNSSYTDPKIDTTIAANLWATNTIIYDYRSNAYDFESGDARKWVSKIVINADNITSLSLDIYSNNDNSGVFKELKPIIDRGNIEWGDPTLVWGDESLRWNYYPTVSAWRRFPKDGLRCQYKQLRFTNSYVTIDDSTIIGNCSIDSTLKEITLLDFPANEWISDAPGYYISFASDSYSKEYLITDNDGEVLTVSDSADTLADQTSTAWKIKGYRKREVLSIMNYVVQFNYMTTTQAPYKAQSGEG